MLFGLGVTYLISYTFKDEPAAIMVMLFTLIAQSLFHLMNLLHLNLKNRFLIPIEIGVLFILSIMIPAITLFCLVYLVTIVHVYIFTGLFILYGNLKTHSISGYSSLAIYLLVPLVLIIVPVEPHATSSYLKDAYFYTIGTLNTELGSLILISETVN